MEISSSKKANGKRARVNRMISVSEVRLISANGENVGVVPTTEALQAAGDAGLDLVEISPTANPPVCQIMDYGKYLYEQEKKERLRRKHTKQIQIKEIKFRPFTDKEDYRVKCNKIRKFIEEGNKVKVTLRFRGRELAHQELGLELLKRVESDLAEEVSVEQRAKREGRQMIMVLAPKKSSA